MAWEDIIAVYYRRPSNFAPVPGLTTADRRVVVPGCSVSIVPSLTAELTGTLWFVDPGTYHWWHQAGRPGPQRWRITITPEGQHITLTKTATAP